MTTETVRDEPPTGPPTGHPPSAPGTATAGTATAATATAGTATAATATGAGGPADRPDGGPRRWPGWLVDGLVLGGYLLAGIALVGRLWLDVERRYLAHSLADQQGFEWIIATVADAVVDGRNPFFTEVLNAPFGVNLMAQTSIIGLSLPLLPVTLLAGPATTFVILMTVGLAGTAAGWYWIFSRHLVDSRFAAAVGGVFCGFAPPMVAHASGGHLNYIAQFVLPVLVWRVLRLGTPGRWARNGAVVGLLVAYQAFIGEEPLLLCALGLAVFVPAYAAVRRAPAALREAAGPFLAGLAVAAVVAGGLLAYPLWWQFFGPQSYTGIPHAAAVGNDLFALTTFASQSLGGGHSVTGVLAMNPTEENGFFGWPVLVLAATAAGWLWRHSPVARAAAVTAAVFLVASLGTELVVAGTRTGLPAPWRLLAGAPLVGSILPGRLVFVAIPAIATLLVLATARVYALAAGADGQGEPRGDRSAGRALRLLWVGALIAVLAPIAPTPLETVGRARAPEFFTADTWRRFVPPGGVIMAVPPPDGSHVAPVRWQLAANLGFRHVEGYFIGPHGTDRHGWYGAERRPTAELLYQVGRTGTAQPGTPEQRRAALADARFWDVDALVLGPGHPHAAALRQTVDALFGPGQRIGDIWLWDTRPLTRH